MLPFIHGPEHWVNRSDPAPQNARVRRGERAAGKRSVAGRRSCCSSAVGRVLSGRPHCGGVWTCCQRGAWEHVIGTDGLPLPDEPSVLDADAVAAFALGAV